MGISIAEQTNVFFYSIILGTFLAAIYEIIRMLRVLGLKKNWMIITSDIIFMIFAAFSTFIFALGFLNGQVRFFILFGELLGFLIFRYTVGELLSRIYSKIFVQIKKIVIFFCKKIKKIFKLLLQNIVVSLYNIINKIKVDKYLKIKTKKTIKKTKKEHKNDKNASSRSKKNRTA